MYLYIYIYISLSLYIYIYISICMSGIPEVTAPPRLGSASRANI